MTTFMPQIRVDSGVGDQEFLNDLEARGREWRESRLGPRARRAGIVRWNIKRDGARIRISPALGISTWTWNLPRYALVLSCQVQESGSGSRLTGSFRTSKVFLGWSLYILLNQVLYPIMPFAGSNELANPGRWIAGLEQVAIVLMILAALLIVSAWASRGVFEEVIVQAHDLSDVTRGDLSERAV